MYVVLTDVVQVMLVSLGLCLPSAATSDVTLFVTVVVIRSKIKLCSGVCCSVMRWHIINVYTDELYYIFQCL